MNRKLLTLIAVGVLAALVIVAVVLSFVFFSNRTTLAENLSTTKVPVWSKTTGKVQGWNVVAAPSSSNSYQQFTKTNLINFVQTGVTASPTAKYCTAIAQTAFLPSYQIGEGDAYLSKYSAYSQAQNVSTTLKNEKTVWVKTSKGSVEFVTGSYANKPTATLNNSSTTTVTSPVSVITATRAVDVLYVNGATKENSPTITGLYGSNPYKGIPVLTLTYSCYNKTASQTEFNTLLNALTANIQ